MLASQVADNLLDKHFGTSVRKVKCNHYENGEFQFFTLHHTHHLAWAAGENWKMLSKSKSYEILGDLA